MDLRRLKAAYGQRVTFFGNTDCGTTRSFASPGEIERVTRQCPADADRRGRGGHVFYVSNAITASAPLVNYLTMINTYRRLFGLPAPTVP